MANVYLEFASRMSLIDILLVMLGAFCGGFVSGLAGFGTGITAMGIWLYAVSPPVAATLVIVCSLVAQAQTLPKVWHAINRQRVLSFVLPGLIGVPVGTLLLTYVDARTFKLLIAVLLLVYSTSQLAAGRWRLVFGGRSIEISANPFIDRVVGFVGGVFGGLAGLSGPLLVIWSSFRNWSKDERRSTLQAFNVSVLSLALIAHLLAGQFVRELLLAAALALPGTVAGAWAGSKLYVAASESLYRKVLSSLLMLCAITLLWTNW